MDGNGQPRFSARAKEIMRNWDEIHECKDSHDADRRWKWQRINKKMEKYTKDVVRQLPAEFWNDPSSVTAADKPCQIELDAEMAFMLASFIGANWLAESHGYNAASGQPISTTDSGMQDPFASLSVFKARWQAQIGAAACNRAHT